MGNEVLITVTAEDATAATRDKVLAGWKQLVASITESPLVFTAQDGTIQARESIEKSWYDLADVVSNTPMVFTAEDGTAATRDKVEVAWYELADAVEAAPVTFTAIDDTGTARNNIERAYNQLVDDVEARPVAITAVNDTAPAVAQAEASIKELAAEVAATPINLQASDVASFASPGSGPTPWWEMPGAGSVSYAGIAQQIEAAANAAPIQLKVANPVNDAFLAQVRSSIKGIANDALQIPVSADTAPFEANVESVLAQLAGITKLDVPLQVGDAMIFRETVAAQVAEVSQSVKAVIDVQINDTGLTDLQAKTLAASQATVDLVGAEQKLSSVLQGGDEEQIAKARWDVVDATTAQRQATQDLEEAQAAATATSAAMADGEKAATAATFDLNAAMGPLWMVMNVAQMAMFAFTGTSNSASSATQNLSQQVVSLGNATGNSASGMLTGNTALAKMNDQLRLIGSSSTQFAQAFSGSVAQATQYTTGLEHAQAQLGAVMVTTTQQVASQSKASGEFGDRTVTTSQSIAQLAQKVNDGTITMDSLSQATQAQVSQWNAYAAAVPQAKQELAALQAQQAIEKDQLDAIGFSLTTGQSAWNEYGNSVQSSVKAFQNATSGLKYTFDSIDQADVAAGQAAQQWQQLNQAVTTAGQAYSQAAQGVANAEHAVAQSAQAVDQARHNEQQSILGVQNAEQALANAQNAETTAQNNLTAARQQAADQLKSLQLQVADQANTEAAAQLRLFQAQQAVNAANLQGRTLSSLGPLSVANENSYQLLLNLAQAQAALNDAKNQSSVLDAQNAAAQAAGVNGATGVLSAQQQLLQSQQQVQSATESLANAQYSQQQASLAVQNALYSQQQASLAVKTAQEAEQVAAMSLTNAKDNATRSTDGNTLASAQNRDTIEQLYQKNVAVYGPTMQAATATEIQGEKAGFTAGQVDAVITQLGGLNGQVSTFSIIGMPSMNINALINQAASQGIDPALMGFSSSQIGNARADQPQGSSYATGGPIGGSGGPTEDNQLIWASVGEHMWTAEEVQKAGGHQAVAALRAAVRGYASGGPIGETMLRANGLLTLADTAGMAIAGVMERFGQHPQPSQLPASNGVIDFSSLAAASYGGYGGGSNVSGDRAANKAIMQAVFASYGWGSGPEWAAQDYVEMREAGYNNFAQNPESTAFGMGQFLDSTWASYGFTKTSDPRIQSIAMAEYEKARYGDPLGAAAHERAFNWYGGGGSAGSGGWIGVGEYGPELLRVPAGSSVMPAANTATALAQAPQSLAVELHVTGDTDQALAVLLMRMMRERKIQIQSRWITP